MDQNNHGFYQPDGVFHGWAPTTTSTNTVPMLMPNHWNMQQMNPNIPSSDFIPIPTHYEPDNRFMHTIHHHPPQITPISFEPHQYTTNYNTCQEPPMMMNPPQNSHHQFGCLNMEPMSILNPSYPINQVNNLDSRDYNNTNSFVSYPEPRLIIQQPSPIVQPSPLATPLVQSPQTIQPAPQIAYPPERLYERGLFVSDFVSQSPSLPNTYESNINFQNKDTANDIQSDMTYTLTSPCSPKTSDLLPENHDEVRLSKSSIQMRSNIRKHEESAKRALLLKRKELKWKLMEASQAQNRAKLEEIRAEADYNKKKMVKIATLATKLRNKFVKVAKASKMAESLYKKVELRLLTQEKFVADEKMQLTRLAVDCQNIGTEIYGPSYELTSNFNSPKSKMKQRLATKIKEAKSDLNNRMMELEKNAYMYASAKRLMVSARAQASSLKALESNGRPSTRLSPLYDLKNSILKNLASYRLTTKFAETGIPITDLRYTHNICANCNICLPDFIGTCTDKNCLYQHKSNYIMADIDKLADILSYKPSLTGFKADPEQSKEENESQCRLKLKQYAAKLLAKNSDKPVETIAQNLVKYVRANRSDHELLISLRELPKAGHLVCNIPEELNSPAQESDSTGSDEVSIEKPDEEEVSIVDSDDTSVESNNDDK